MNRDRDGDEESTGLDPSRQSAQTRTLQSAVHKPRALILSKARKGCKIKTASQQVRG